MHAQLPRTIYLTALTSFFLAHAADTTCYCEGALPALKALHDATNGPTWSNPWSGNLSNASDVSVCSLSGVECLGVVDASGNNGLLSIDLSFRNLSGTIPSSFAMLYPWVNYFHMTNNNLTGTLPTSLSLFGKHINEFVFASNADLSGTLPPEFSNWTAVTVFSISSCSFTGTIPAVYANFTRITSFSVQGNRLTGTIPVDLASWSWLNTFIISSNQFSGTFPQLALTSWPTMLAIELSDNKFSGTIFSEALCTSWKNLNSFRCSNNSFSGTLPSCLALWGPTINLFFINNNIISGTFPLSLQNWTLLREFDCGSNRFSGSLPPEWAAMTSMTSFQVDRNNLTGTLPLQYASWTNVSRFLVNNNALLTGSIPDAYSSWGSNAIDLRFSFCNFTGTLPTSWAFDHINMLLFSENQLSGTLPSSFGGMKSISILSLDGNDFSGTLPASWSALTGAQVIGVRNNTNLSGPIPPSWSAMTQLAVLAFCFTAICGNASMFALIGLVGFGCPETSAIETFSSLATTELVAYVIQLTRVTTVSCTSPASTTHIPSSAPSPNKTEPSNASSASVLPYTAAAKSAATAAVWTVAATQGLKLSGGASPAASVAFLQGAFAASRLRRLCTANSSTSTEDSPPLSDPMDNPTEIELTDAAGNYAGGAIVGNSSLLVAVILLNQLAVFIRSWRRKRSAPSKVSSITTRAINWLVDHLVPSEGIHFPGSAAMVYGLLMPPTVAACVVIFMNSTGGSEGVGAGAYVLAALLGIVVWILPLGYLAWRMQCSPFPFTTARHAANKKARRNFSESKNTSLWRRMFSSIAEFLFTPTHTWKLLPTSSSSQVNSKDQKGGAQRAFYKSYGVFFVGTRSEWRMLFALELFIALVGGAVQGAGEGVASSGDAADACSAAEWTSATLAALSGVVLVLHVVVWPCLVRYDDLQTIVLTALTVASEIASAIGGDVGEQVGNALSLAAAVIQVILVVLEIAIALLCFEGRIRITSPFSATIPNAQPPLDFGELRLRLPRIGTDYQLPSIAHSERPVVNNHHSHDSALCASPQQHQQYVSLQQIRLKQLLYMVAAQHHHRCRSSKETKGLKT